MMQRSPRVELSYPIRKGLSDWIIKAPGVIGINVQTGQIQPTPSEWDDRLLEVVYCPTYCLSSLQGISRDRKATGNTLVALDYGGTQEPWRPDRVDYTHQIRLVVAVPGADVANENECYNLRDYLVAAIEWGLSKEQIDLIPYSWTGVIRRELSPRIQYDEDDELYLSSVTLAIGLK